MTDIQAAAWMILRTAEDLERKASAAPYGNLKDALPSAQDIVARARWILDQCARGQGNEVKIMAAKDQVMTLVGQDLDQLLVPPEHVMVHAPQLGVVVITCVAELLGKIAAHFGMLKISTYSDKYLPVSYHGWRLYLDREE